MHSRVIRCISGPGKRTTLLEKCQDMLDLVLVGGPSIRCKVERNLIHPDAAELAITIEGRRGGAFNTTRCLCNDGGSRSRGKRLLLQLINGGLECINLCSEGLLHALKSGVKLLL